MPLLSYEMKKVQICETINISWRLVSLHTILDKNFESELEWHIQSFNPNLEIRSRVLDQPIFKMKLWKKHLELQTFRKLSSMASAYLDKMCVHFLELPFLKCNENAVFLLKNTHNKEK